MMKNPRKPAASARARAAQVRVRTGNLPVNPKETDKAKVAPMKIRISGFPVNPKVTGKARIRAEEGSQVRRATRHLNRRPTGVPPERADRGIKATQPALVVGARKIPDDGTI